VRNACVDASCLERVYLQRLAVLDPLQPGASALKNVSLPRVKALAWVIHPQESDAPAPPKKSLPELVLTGRLRNEVADGDGFVLEDAAGAKHPVQLSMFLSEPSGSMLEVLAKEAHSRFEVRGQREIAGDGSAHISPNGCTFIYRLPK
jgi:hypothetical protein